MYSKQYVQRDAGSCMLSVSDTEACQGSGSWLSKQRAHWSSTVGTQLTVDRILSPDLTSLYKTWSHKTWTALFVFTHRRKRRQQSEACVRHQNISTGLWAHFILIHFKKYSIRYESGRRLTKFGPFTGILKLHSLFLCWLLHQSKCNKK